MADERDTQLRELMHAAQSGDDAAYSTLLKSLLPLVRAGVYRRRSFLPAADREDLVQEILLSIHSVRSTYEADRPFLPWMNAIVANRLADKGRRDQRQRRILEIGEDFHETFPALTTNVTEVAARDQEKLLAEIERLPTSQRKAVELLKLREMSLADAADESGMTVSTLKVSMHRAMKALKGRLLGDGW